MEDTIIFRSNHKVLTFGSCFEYESGRHGTCFAMNSDGFILDWNVCFSQRLYVPELMAFE